MKQISIMSRSDNTVAELTALLSANDLDIRDMSFVSAGNNGVINLRVEDCDTCLALLAANGYDAISDETLLLKLADRPGALAGLSRQISDAGIAIRSLTLVGTQEKEGVVAISTSDNSAVRALYPDTVIN
jgi:hypothetical protein